MACDYCELRLLGRPQISGLRPRTSLIILFGQPEAAYSPLFPFYQGRYVKAGQYLLRKSPLLP